MNTAIFRRLLWKEFRQQRAFWLAMVFLAVLLMMLFELSFTLLSTNSPKYSYQLNYIFCLAVLYALGCGATSFAGEHDAGTFQYLRKLPLAGLAVFLSKITFAVLATLGFVCVLYPPTNYVVENLHKSVEVFPWPVWCLGIASALAWGVLFSQLVKRPLLAAFLGGVLGSGSYILVISLVEEWTAKTKAETYYPIFSAMLVALCLANAWLGWRWLNNRPSLVRGFTTGWGLFDSTYDALHNTNMQSPRTSTMLKRLTWQQWRFSRLMMGVIMLGWIVFLILHVIGGPSFPEQSLLSFANWTLVGNFSSVFAIPEKQLAVFPFFILLALIMVTLFGCMVFRGDQRGHSVRYLSERAARPWQVWFSRQIVWGLPFLLFGLLSFLLCIIDYVYLLIGTGSRILEHASLQEVAWWSLWHFWKNIMVRTPEWIGVVGIFFAAGQLCSMLFRSGLLAVVFSVMLSSVCVIWLTFVLFMGGSPIWSVLPIAVGMFAATLLLAPDWMRERVGWRQYVRPVAVVVVPLLVILVVIPVYRVYSIPGGGPGFDMAEFSRPETEPQRETVAMYNKAGNLLVPHNNPLTGIRESQYDPLTVWNLKVSIREEQMRHGLKNEVMAWIEKNENAIELAIAASRRESCGQIDHQNMFPPTATLAYLLVLDGHLLTGEGKLDEAAEKYFAALRIASHLQLGITFRGGEIIEGRAYEGLRYWSAAPGQTTERIKAAIKEIDAIAKTRPPREQIVKTYYMQFRSEILADKDSAEFSLPDYGNHWASILWYSLPWEKARLLRMLDRATANDLKSLEEMRDPTVVETRMLPPFTELSSQFIGPLSYAEKRSSRCGRKEPGNFGRIAFYELNTITVRRATKIILALEAWKAEHGELPNSLQQLVGPYFKKIPPMPARSGKVFAYFPKGLPKRLLAYPPEAGNYKRYDLDYFRPNFPLLVVCNQEDQFRGGQEERPVFQGDTAHAGGDLVSVKNKYGARTTGDIYNEGFAFHIP